MPSLRRRLILSSCSLAGTETVENSDGVVCHEMLEGTPAFMAPELCSCAYHQV
jgi:hypothetical protein